jgi:hypothetical protein
MQNRPCREYAARRGWAIAMQVREAGSGAAKRQAREKRLEAVCRREIDGVWRLDRRSAPEGLACDTPSRNTTSILFGVTLSRKG